MPLRELGRWLVVVGLVTTVCGVVLLLAGRIPGAGRLPGDLWIRGDRWSLFVPITTCVLLSLLLTLLLNLFFRR